MSTWRSLLTRVSFPAPVADTSDTVYSLHGSVLKFDDLPSIEPYLTQLDEVKDLQEVRFGGNTLGVDACKGVADALAEKNNLQVSSDSIYTLLLQTLMAFIRCAGCRLL